ncbi:MAG TPA: nuclear transport factor 2 family protein, partial [Candidatus Limnocylindria bacterium]|nr:nuclear transport factor 2 family protein [Candidatus Limnocylindria bacterium]
MIDRLCRLWSGASSSGEFAALLAEGFVFHWHHEDRPGAAAYESFVAAARSYAPRLQMVADQTLSQGDLVVLYFHWASNRWHPDISEAGDRSNFGKIVLRITGGKIAELWEQASDFLYLLGKGLPGTLMNYPAVATATLFLRDAHGLFPTDDPKTLHMAGLFRQMNDCFLGHCPISKIHDVQEPDIRFDFDGGK